MTGTRRQERIWEYLRETGRPTLLRFETPEVRWALSKLRSYSARGMSLSAMANQVELSQDAVTRLLREKRPGIRRSTFDKIRQVRFDDVDGLRGPVPVLGSQRRLRALRADGFPYTLLCEQMGHQRNSPRLQRILTGERSGGGAVGFLIGSTARDIEQMYEKLAGTDPRGLGVTDHGVNYSKRRAARLGYAPSGCWDPDTIDDPAAIPDWTGRCGTRFGAAVHKREGIPVCGPCRGAYTGELYPGFSGDMLRRLRERRGVSRRALAESLNCNAATVQYWENGRNKPTRQGKLDNVLAALDGTYEDVCEDE